MHLTIIYSTLCAIRGLLRRAALPNQKAIVLVVDDDAKIREVIVDMLRHVTEYVVLEAASGPEALDVFSKQQGRIDLLLTDLIMPGMTGRQLADTLIAQCPGLAVVFMSGYIDEARSETMEKGLHFIQKPATSAKLAATIGDVLKKRKKAVAP